MAFLDFQLKGITATARGISAIGPRVETRMRAVAESRLTEMKQRTPVKDGALRSSLHVTGPRPTAAGQEVGWAAGGTGGDGGEGTPTGDEGDSAPTGPASITASGTNAAGAVLYQIGPGQVFARTGGDADTVWCRPGSDCNGEGGNRTAVNTASPPAAWIAEGHAVFRRSGTMGTTVTFTVDGVTLAHDFSTGG